MSRLEDIDNMLFKARRRSTGAMRVLLAAGLLVLLTLPTLALNTVYVARDAASAGDELPDAPVDAAATAAPSWAQGAPQQHAPHQHAPHEHAPHEHAPYEHAPHEHVPRQHVAPDVPLHGAAPVEHGDHVRVTAAPAPSAMAPGEPLQLVCPESDQVLGLPPLPLANDPVYAFDCPFRIYDTGYSFGNAQMHIDHADHRQVAFTSLHGGPTRDGPSQTARAGQTHVAFTSGNQGFTWQDQPTEGGQYQGAYGMQASGAMDSMGNLYTAYEWARPDGEDTEGAVFTGIIGLFKGPQPGVPNGMIDAYTRGTYIDARQPGNEITRSHLVHVPSFAPELNDTNETQAPSNETENGEPARDLENATAERVVLTWHERAYDWTNSSTGLSAWIDVAWSDVGSGNNWTRINQTQVIGPCREASNPVQFEGKVYVACVVDRGYQDRSRARVGDIDIWEIDIDDGRTRLHGQTGLEGGRPLLAVNEEGFMALVSYMKDYAKDGDLTKLSIQSAFGWYGRTWSPMGGDIGYSLRQTGGGANVPLLDADVTALVLTTDEPTALLVYKEWHDDPQEPQIPEDGEPQDLITNQLTDYNKFVVSFTPCEYPVAGLKFELGAGVDVNNARAYEINPGVFNDHLDGLMVTREQNTDEELVYFAINDYGAMQYGAIISSSASAFCPIGSPPPPVPAVPVAQALTVAGPNQALLGAAVAVPAAAMTLYLLLARKKAPSYVAAEDK